MKDTKLIRGQLRQVLKEILPETLIETQLELLNKKIDARLNQISEDTKATMREMNQRHRDTMGYLVRQVSKPSDQK